jgi:superfamily II DNA or RNA helicase
MNTLTNTLTIFTPTVTLKPSQRKVKQALYQAIKDGNERVLVVAPCAWGKTIFASSVIADAVTKGRKCLFIVHAEVLIAQTLNALAKFGLNTGVIAGAYKENRTADVQVATVQALASRSKKDLDTWFNPDVVIIDEAHDRSLWSLWTQKKFPKLSNGQVFKDNDFLLPYLEKIGLLTANLTWQEIQKAHKQASIKAHPDHGGSDEAMKIINLAWEQIKKHKARFADAKTNEKINSLNAYNAVLIGLTGSPYRLKKTENMGDFFQSQVLAPTPKEMVEDGYLTPCVYYGLKKIKTEGVRTSSLGDFNTEDLTTNAMEVVKDLIPNYQNICPERTFICFACSVRHAQMIVQEFNDNGIKVKIVTGDTDPKNERPIIYNELRKREIQGIVSVDCLTTGFDVTNISCILLARPTKSLALYIQMIGRGMRLHENKEDCYVLDQSGNVRKFGFIESLTYPELGKGKQREKGEAPVKECPNCHQLVPISTKVCTCGYVFPSKEKEQKRKATGELVLLITKEQEPIFNFYRGKIAQLYYAGKNPGQAVYLTQQMFSNKELSIPLWIPSEWAKGAIFGKKPKESHRLQYWSYLRHYAQSHQKDMTWVNRMFTLEFGVGK